MVFAIIAAAVAVIVIAVFIAVYFMFVRAFGRKDKYVDIYDDKAVEPYHFGERITDIRAGFDYMKTANPEEVYITSFDGLRLYGRIIPADNPVGTIILFHGYHSFIEFDFSCVIKKYHDMKYNLLLATQRSHGKSEGKYICFGALERRDCVLWAEYAEKRFGKELPIVLQGLSMGASTVLMASELPLPQNVVAIIADCGFTSPDEIIVHVACDLMHAPYFPTIPILRLYAKMLAHYGTKDASTVDALKKTTLPVLLIHGDADTFVPYAMNVKNNEACASPHVFVTVKGANHGQSYLIDQAKCDDALDSFLKKYVSSK